MKKAIINITLALISCIYTASAIEKVNIVAAENFYGSITKQIGGKYVDVLSIISNPNSDPHLFSTSPKVSTAVSDAQVIIYNGVDYDPWMQSLINSHPEKDILTIINVGKIMNIANGKNPHIWYKPETFPVFAKLITQKLIEIYNSPSAATYFNQNLKSFLNKNQQVQNKIIELKASFNGIAVTATEPVFGYMAQAIGLEMKGLAFQWKVMNDAEPSPKMLANYENNITSHQVKVLFYNNQVTDPTTSQVLSLAKKSGLPIVGVSETMPLNDTVNSWFMSELKKTERALSSISNHD